MINSLRRKIGSLKIPYQSMSVRDISSIKKHMKVDLRNSPCLRKSYHLLNASLESQN